MDTQELIVYLQENDLVKGSDVTLTPLTGGVSSDIRLVNTPDRTFVVKRALDKLRVKDDWYADRSRNNYEQAYMRYVGEVVPDAVPAILFSDPDAGLFAMEYLGEGYDNWKSLLLAGKVNRAYAGEAGRVLGQIHSATWGDKAAATAFDSTSNFFELRLEPYLLTTGQRHPNLASYFEVESARIQAMSLALVHGDYSPKNMLVRPDRFVLLDCEVAWYGEPAFDVAFLCNHFFLKSLNNSGESDAFLALVSDFWDCYVSELGESLAFELEARVARLLPMLLLARVDGKSPVEYITEPAKQAMVRNFSNDVIPAPPTTLSQLIALWQPRLQDR